MNQILSNKFKMKNSKTKQFKTIFLVSIISVFIFMSFYISYLVQLNKEEKYSSDLLQNYQVYKLYANSNTQKNSYKDSDILGNISIPKLNLNYPFFYGIDENLLKFAPCRFYGDMPNKISNLCIAGHNYDDDRFFSKISDLVFGDLIIIEDNNQNTFSYFVYDKFEIDDTEISTIKNHSGKSQELTLLTCNNSNNKRIIVKAIAESL